MSSWIACGSSDVHGDLVYMGSIWRTTAGPSGCGSTTRPLPAADGRASAVTGGRDIVIEHNTIHGRPHGHDRPGAASVVRRREHPHHRQQVRPGPTALDRGHRRGSGSTRWWSPATHCEVRPSDSSQTRRDGTRRQRYWIVDNTSDTPANRDAAALRRTSTAWSSPATGRPSQGRTRLWSELIHTCGVSVGGNDMKPGTLPFTGEGPPLRLHPPAGSRPRRRRWRAAGRNGRQRRHHHRRVPPTDRCGPDHRAPSTRQRTSASTTSAPTTEASPSTSNPRRRRRIGIAVAVTSSWPRWWRRLLAAGIAILVTISARRARR